MPESASPDAKDLPARLRRWAKARDKRLAAGGHAGVTGTELLREAADEIEALREQVNSGREIETDQPVAGPPTEEEIATARKRLAPYLAGYPEPMIDTRRLRIANGTASVADRRAVAAENAVIRELRGAAPDPAESSDQLPELRPIVMADGTPADAGPYFVGYGDEWQVFGDWDDAWRHHVMRGSTVGRSHIKVRADA